VSTNPKFAWSLFPDQANFGFGTLAGGGCVIRAAFWVFIIIVALALALFAVSNRESVSLALWPLPFVVDLPLYLLVLATLVFGFIFGEFASWIAARHWRREVRRRGRRIASLERELSATQAQLAPLAGDASPSVVRRQ